MRAFVAPSSSHDKALNLLRQRQETSNQKRVDTFLSLASPLSLIIPVAVEVVSQMVRK